MIARLKSWAASLKRILYTLYLAVSHPATPWYARLLGSIVVAYALSPIDLIPDPIPILGYLDDLILLPVGIWLTLKMIPAPVWAECQARVEAEGFERPRPSRAAAAVIVALWALAIFFLIRLTVPFVARWL